MSITSVYKYKNKEWIQNEDSFPKTVNTFKDVRKHLELTNYLYVSNCSTIEVYSGSYDETNGTKSYAVELCLFGRKNKDDNKLIICDTFFDLLNLFNELNGYFNIVVNEK